MHIKNLVAAAVLACTVLPSPAADLVSAVSFTNDHAVMSIDAQGRLASLKLRSSGRELIDAKRKRALVTMRLNGREPVLKLSRVEEGGRLRFAFPDEGEAVLKIESFGPGWTIELVSSTRTNIDEIIFARLSPQCHKYEGRFVNGWSDDHDAVILRAYDIKTEMRYSWRGFHLEVAATPFSGFSGVKAGLVAAPREAIIPALAKMIELTDAPRSSTGGPNSLAAEENRDSYLFAYPDPSKLDEWIDLADRGGFTTLHFHGWHSNRGEFNIAKCLNRDINEFKKVVDRLHARGMKAGIHTLTACISPWSPWVAENVRDLDKVKSFTLAEPLTPTSTVVTVNEEVEGRFDTVMAYGSNGNFLRVGDELIQYFEVKKGKRGSFGKCKRGVYKTKRSAHKAGERCDFIRQSINSLYPDPLSPLADKIANRMAEVCNVCGMDEIFFDGSEKMDTRYGIDAMRWKTIAALDGRRPVVNEASVERQHNWWFHSRIRYTDHPKFAAKAFVDFHVATANAGRRGEFLAAQTGWWAPRRPSPVARGFFLDETEYFASRNAGNDLASSMQNIDMVESGVRQDSNEDSREPMSINVERQVTVAGWYERPRLARAFAPGVPEMMEPKGAEARLRQDSQSGVWMISPVTSLVHRTAGAAMPDRWTFDLGESRKACVRIEALYAAGDYDDPSAIPLTKGDTRFDSTAPEVAFPDGGWRSYRMLTREFDDGTKDLSNHRAFGLKVTGDGSGAVLNVSLVPGPIHGYRFSDSHLIKLDFTGERYYSFLLREKDIAEVMKYNWATYLIKSRNVFMCDLNAKYVNGVVFNLAGIPRKGKTDIKISEVRALPVKKAKLTDIEFSLDGRVSKVPFPLVSGEWAEYEDGAWIRYSEDGRPLSRVEAEGPDCFAAGSNVCGFSAKCDTAGVRAETTLFAVGKKVPAFRENLTAKQEKILSYEAMMPEIWAPAKGFSSLPPIAVRPGKTASLDVEIIGPIKDATLRIGDWSAPLPSIASKNRFRCRDGKRWRVTDLDRKTVAEGIFKTPLPVLSGSTKVSLESSDPEAYARVNFIKRYDSGSAYHATSARKNSQMFNVE